MGYSNFYARFYAICQRTGQTLGAIWRFPASRWYLALIGLFQIFAWLQAWFIRRDLTGDLLVLHYNVNFGTDLVGAPSRIFVYPLFGLGIFLLDLIVLAALARHRDWRVFVHLLLGTAMIFGLLLSLVLLSVYLINFR